MNRTESTSSPQVLRGESGARIKDSGLSARRSTFDCRLLTGFRADVTVTFEADFGEHVDAHTQLRAAHAAENPHVYWAKLKSGHNYTESKRRFMSVESHYVVENNKVTRN